MKYVIADDVVNEINQIDGLAASIQDGEIEIEVLNGCGNKLVDEVIDELYKNDCLVFIHSDESSSLCTYGIGIPKGRIGDIVEGGVALFDTYDEYETWKGQR